MWLLSLSFKEISDHFDFVSGRENRGKWAANVQHQENFVVHLILLVPRIAKAMVRAHLGAETIWVVFPSSKQSTREKLTVKSESPSRKRAKNSFSGALWAPEKVFFSPNSCTKGCFSPQILMCWRFLREKNNSGALLPRRAPTIAFAICSTFKTRLETLRPFGTRKFHLFCVFFCQICYYHHYPPLQGGFIDNATHTTEKIEETADQRIFSKKKKLCDIAIACATFLPAQYTHNVTIRGCALLRDGRFRSWQRVSRRLPALTPSENGICKKYKFQFP